MTTAQTQATIIHHLQLQTPKGISLAEHLAGVLNLQKNAVYKRLNGATLFNLEDLTALAKHYHLPWERILNEENPSFSVAFSRLSSQTSIIEYLRGIEQDALSLTKASHPQVKYLTVGLPDFYYFYFEDLTLFQLFIWDRMIWDDPAHQDLKFNLETKGKEELLSLTKRLANFYSYIPAVEIWSEHILDNLFHQIQYALDSNLFENREDSLALCSNLHDLVSHLEIMAKEEKRFPFNAFPSEKAATWSLHYCEIMQNNILVLAKAEQMEVVYSVFDNPNFLKSNDPHLVAHAKAVFQKYMRRAFTLGKDGEKYRGNFFERLRKRLNRFEKEVNHL